MAGRWYSERIKFCNCATQWIQCEERKYFQNKWHVIDIGCRVNVAKANTLNVQTQEIVRKDCVCMCLVYKLLYMCVFMHKLVSTLV